MREQGTAQTQAALKGLQAVGVGVGAALGAAVAVAAAKITSSFVDVAREGVMLASSLNESRSKVGVVFGQMTGDIEAFSKDSARNLGLSQQAALEAAGTFGNLFTAMGITQPAAAGMSKEILQLSADLASFNNIPVADALEKIRAGLVGESEPLRALGVNLNETTIKAEAMRLGLMKQGETLTASGKAQAAYSLIMQQTATAQGDFARTSAGLANQQKTLEANILNLKAALGTALLPIVTSVTTEMNKLIEKNGEEWSRKFADGVAILARQLEVAAEGASKFLGFLKDINNATGGNLGDALSHPFGFSASERQQGKEDWLNNLAKAQGRLPLNFGSQNPAAVFEPFGGAKLTTDPRFVNSGPPGATSLAGGGGGKSALQSAWESIHETLLNETIRGGEDRIAATEEEQARLLEQTQAMAQRFSEILGVDLAKTLIPAFETIRDREKEMAEQRKKASEEAIENAKKVMATELEMSRQRVSLTEDLWRRFGGGNSVGAASNLAMLAAAATAGDTTKGGSQAAADRILQINIAGQRVADVIIPAINQAARDSGPVIDSGAVG